MAASRLAGSAQLYRTLVEGSADLILVTDAEGRIRYANEAARALLGFEPEEMVGAPLSSFLPDELEAEVASMSERAVRGRPQGPRLITARHRDGSDVRLRLRAMPLAGAGGRGGATLVASEAGSEEQRELQLTQLIRDNELILRSVGEGVIRLDRECRITYANPAAGEILGCGQVELMGRDVHELLGHSHREAPKDVHEDCPIYASLRGEVVHRSDDFFWRPDGTWFAVKYTSAPIREEGRIVGAVCVFADVSDEKQRELELRWELEWQTRLARAVKGDRLLVYSQPIVDLRSGEQVQEELLVRMRGSGEDIVPPIDFLPTAERLDVITEIDRWMLRRALELVAEGRTVAVNVSARSLAELPLLAEVHRALRESGADPSRLIVEITETAAAEDVEAARRFAIGIDRLGCRLALDDFGTGYGSLTYLKDLPAHFLKIDMEFVAGMRHDEGSRGIVRTIVEIARRHGQLTIAEGVEDAETAELLREEGVDYAQGHRFGEPLPID